MDKFRFKASILPVLKLKASTATQIILCGSTANIIKLRASVVTFAKSLTTRATILSRVLLTVKAITKKIIKNMTIKSQFYMVMKAKCVKHSKALLNSRILINISSIVRKNAKVTIGFAPVIGKSSILLSIKDKTLGQLKSMTLKEITFALGVRAFVIKRMSILLNSQVTVLITPMIVRKTKLSDIKNQTLGTIKTETLRELTEYTL